MHLRDYEQLSEFASERCKTSVADEDARYLYVSNGVAPVLLPYGIITETAPHTAKPEVVLESSGVRFLYMMRFTASKFSSVQLQNLCFTQSYNKNYDGCADAYKLRKKQFSFEPA